MSATTVIALYAAIVATGAGGFQVYSWWHARRPHLRVEVRRTHLGIEDGVIDAVVVKVVNDGDYPARVTATGLVMQDDPDLAMQMLHRDVPGRELPGIIPARDSRIAHLPTEAVGERGIDLRQPVTAFARISTGPTLYSAPTTVAQF